MLSEIFAMSCSTLLSGIVTYLLWNKLDQKSPPLYKCFFLCGTGIRGKQYNNSEILFNLLQPIVEFINESRTSLDLCYYLITDYNISEAIIQARKRNVTVRLITDFHSGIVNNKKYARDFYKADIRIYYDKNANSNQTIMHNKFCIRDNDTLLQSSLNLTNNTANGSYDNVMITTDPKLVEAFKNHFGYLIMEFENNL